MAKVSTNVSIDADIKKQAQELFAELGMDLSTAINIFLRQSIWEHSSPFLISREIPNKETLEAIKETEEIIAHPERYKHYKSFAEAMADMDSEDEVNTNA